MILRAFLITPPGVDILEGGKLTSNNVAEFAQTLFRALRLPAVLFPNPGGDAAGQDALHSAGVE